MPSIFMLHAVVGLLLIGFAFGLLLQLGLDAWSALGALWQLRATARRDVQIIHLSNMKTPLRSVPQVVAYTPHAAKGG